MPSTAAGVPVYVDVSPSDLLQGFFKIEGLLSFTSTTITLEYRTKNMQGRPSAAHILDLPLDDLQEVTLKGRVTTQIILRPRTLTLLKEVPWSVREELVLRVRRAYRKQAASLVAQLQQELSNLHSYTPGSIPFQLPTANYGLTEINGLLYLDDEFLVFEIGTSLPGGSSSQKQTIKIEPGALHAVHLDEGVRHDHLHITPKKRDLLTAMPGTYDDALALKIAKRYREDTEQLIDAIARMQQTYAEAQMTTDDRRRADPSALD